jgi:hypothetical protein
MAKNLQTLAEQTAVSSHCLGQGYSMARKDEKNERTKVVKDHLQDPEFKKALRSRYADVRDDQRFKKLLEQLEEAERRQRKEDS